MLFGLKGEKDPLASLGTKVRIFAEVSQAIGSAMARRITVEPFAWHLLETLEDITYRGAKVAERRKGAEVWGVYRLEGGGYLCEWGWPMWLGAEELAYVCCVLRNVGDLWGAWLARLLPEEVCDFAAPYLREAGDAEGGRLEWRQVHNVGRLAFCGDLLGVADTYRDAYGLQQVAELYKREGGYVVYGAEPDAQGRYIRRAALFATPLEVVIWPALHAGAVQRFRKILGVPLTAQRDGV